MTMSCTSSPSNVRNGSGGTFRDESGRRVLRQIGRNLHRAMTDHRLTTREVTQAISETLVGIPTKEIADATGGSLRAAQNAREGLNAMSLTHFLNAAQRLPELRVLALQFLEAEGEANAGSERALHDLMVAAQRFADMRSASEASDGKSSADASVSHPQQLAEDDESDQAALRDFFEGQ